MVGSATFTRPITWAASGRCCYWTAPAAIPPQPRRQRGTITTCGESAPSCFARHLLSSRGVLGLSLQPHSATSLPSPCPKTTISINRTTSSLFKGLAIQSMRLPFLGPRSLPQSLHASIGRHWSFKMAPSSTRSSARLRRICFSLPPSLASPVGSTCSSSTNRAQTH